MHKWWFRLINNRGEVKLPDAEEPDDDATKVTVDDEPPSQKTTPQADSKQKDDADKDDKGADAEKRWKAMENQLSAGRRVTESIQRDLASIRQALAQRPVAQPSGLPSKGADALPEGTDPATVDKYDKLMLEGDWQGAVRLLAREEASHVVKTRDAEEGQRQREAKRLETLERQKQMVRERYAALHEESGNPESQEWQLYNEAINQLSGEDPDFLGNPYSPTLAMTRMEALAAERGIRLSAARAPTSPPVGARRPVPRPASASNVYTITKEQKEWADRYLSHLPPEQRYKHYASFAKRTEAEGEVSAE